MSNPDLKTLPIYSRSQDSGDGDEATYKVHLTENATADRCMRLVSMMPSDHTSKFIRNHAIAHGTKYYLIEGQMGRLSIMKYDSELGEATCIGSTSYKEMGVW